MRFRKAKDQRELGFQIDNKKIKMREPGILGFRCVRTISVSISFRCVCIGVAYKHSDACGGRERERVSELETEVWLR